MKKSEGNFSDTSGAPESSSRLDGLVMFHRIALIKGSSGSGLSALAEGCLFVRGRGLGVDEIGFARELFARRPLGSR